MNCDCTRDGMIGFLVGFLLAMAVCTIAILR